MCGDRQLVHSDLMLELLTPRSAHRTRCDHGYKIHLDEAAVQEMESPAEVFDGRPHAVMRTELAGLAEFAHPWREPGAESRMTVLVSR
jgi:hypothetical protein